MFTNQYFVVSGGDISYGGDVQQLRPGIYAYGLIPTHGKAPETRKFVVIR